MPVNEINAPVYAKIKYVTPAYGAGHWLRVYFATGTSFVGGAVGDETNWRIQVAGSPVQNMKAIVDQLFQRSETVLPPSTEIETIELWQSAAGANILQHLNPVPLGSFGTANPAVASSYYIEMFSGALREPYRYTMFDGTDGRPQRSVASAPPSGDDDSLEWYMLNSTIPFATQDGIRLTSAKSINIGYNRKLAKAYGRSVTP